MKTMCITGATAGFGEACARLFAALGWKLICVGRREERLEVLARDLAPASVHTAVLDVRRREDVDRVLGDLPEDFREVDVLLNNAGLALGLERAQEGNPDEWEVMVDTNVKGVLHCIHALLPGMVARGRGHIVNMGSIAGCHPYLMGNVYGATKAFVQQLTMNLKADLVGTNVRVTNIEPGMAETEFSLVRFRGDAERAAKVYDVTRALTAEDIAECVRWVVDLPEHVNIARLQVWPTDQGFGSFTIHRREG